MSREGKSTIIEITPGTIVKTILFLVLFYVLFLIKDLVMVVVAAVVIASSIEPATQWLGRHRVRRLPAVLIIYAALAVILAVIFVFFLPRVLTEALTYINNLPANIHFSDLWNPIRESFSLPDSSSSIPLGIGQDFSIKDLIDGVRSIISGTSEGIFRTASIIFGGALAFILIIVLSFYFSVQEDGVGNFLRIVTPPKAQKYVIDLWKRSQLKIGYWLQGQLVLGLFFGIWIYVLLLLLGVKHALLLGTCAALFELIPIFGPILSAVPAVTIAFVEGLRFVDPGIASALIIAGVYLIMQQIENHLIYPLVVRKIVGISPIIVILALVIGAKLAGFLGVILSVPIAAAFMEYIHDIEKDRRTDVGLI